MIMHSFLIMSESEVNFFPSYPNEYWIRRYQLDLKYLLFPTHYPDCPQRSSPDGRIVRVELCKNLRLFYPLCSVN